MATHAHPPLHIDVDISLNLTTSPWGWAIRLSTMDFEGFSFNKLKQNEIKIQRPLACLSLYS